MFWQFLIGREQSSRQKIHTNSSLEVTKIFYNSQEIITQGNNRKCFIGSDKLSYPILALNIDFS